MATDCKLAVGWARHGCKLSSWGANSYGQLGQGHTEDKFLPGDVTPADINICSITGGGGHTLIINDEGELFVCGSNNKGQLGLGHTRDIPTLAKVKVPGDAPVIKASGGWDFTLILTGKGELFAMGSNAFGQLGMPGSNQVSLPVKVQIPDDEKVADVDAGLRHVVMVTDRGNVYCWGAGRKGQCGVLIDKKAPAKLVSPAPVTISETERRVCSVVAGSQHSVAVTDNGDMYLWGCNKYGQCLVDPSQCPSVLTPIPAPPRDWTLTHLSSGWTHLLARTAEGKLYSWGRGDYGQLGRSCDGSCDHIPARILGLPSVQIVSCGSEHNLAVSDDRLAYSWGWNEHGICGTGDEENVHKPQSVSALSKTKVKCLGCGNGHSLVFGSEIT
ncbi:secretion-regulating guanine nucleotide exchange factor-like [Ylistrum balloti]|uniref:secretion-regulating guanine nucleotide exchange factor-like n=1 Tax=Ylistrum balloti TaxID=509963 RepID=UPI002905CB44|nr:secretion-regulating guanine nucleotide exchange factor-like [Ylistrum balloti]